MDDATHAAGLAEIEAFFDSPPQQADEFATLMQDLEQMTAEEQAQVLNLAQPLQLDTNTVRPALLQLVFPMHIHPQETLPQSTLPRAQLSDNGDEHTRPFSNLPTRYYVPSPERPEKPDRRIYEHAAAIKRLPYPTTNYKYVERGHPHLDPSPIPDIRILPPGVKLLEPTVASTTPDGTVIQGGDAAKLAGQARRDSGLPEAGELPIGLHLAAVARGETSKRTRDQYVEETQQGGDDNGQARAKKRKPRQAVSDRELRGLLG